MLRKFEGEVAPKIGTRPHILYNPSSKNYILWSGLGALSGGGYAVSVAPSPTSVFQPVGYAALDPAWSNLKWLPGDAAVYQAGDKAYLAFAAINALELGEGSLWPPFYQTMHITPLTDDFVSTASEASHEIVYLLTTP